MPDIKLVPPTVNLTLYAGDTSTIIFRWPTGALTGRTFTARITPTVGDVIEATVTPAGDVLTVTFDGDDVAALDGATGRFELVETSSGRDEVIIAGVARSSRAPGTPTTSTVTVNQSTAVVEITVARLLPTVNGHPGPVITLTAADVGAPTVAELTTAVAAAVAALVAGAPGALNTLDELAAALSDDANFASTVVTAIATRAAAGDGASAGAAATNALLKGWVSGEAYEPLVITHDADEVVTTATVLWPDGSGGTFTTVTKNTNPPAINAYTITHTLSGKTVIQPLMTRDSEGAVTIKPPLEVA